MVVCSHEVAALTINKVCGSGLKAVMLAAQGIALGDIDIAVAGGMESMSNAPYLLPRAREGLRMGDANLVDSMIHDGLWCAFEHCHMGVSGEHVAEQYGVSRDAQDAYRRRKPSEGGPGRGRRTIQGGNCGVSRFRRRKARPIVMSEDETIRPDSTAAALKGLKPAFKKDGSVTAGNAPGVNDGAAALVVMSEERARSLTLKPMAQHRRLRHERARTEAPAHDAGRGDPKAADQDSAGISKMSICSKSTKRSPHRWSPSSASLVSIPRG